MFFQTTTSPPAARRIWRSKEDCGQRLTFGVELEFCVAYVRTDERDPDANDKRDPDISRPLKDYVEAPIDYSDGDVKPKRGTRYRLKDSEPNRNLIEHSPAWLASRYSKAGPHIRHRIAKFLRSHGVPAVSDSEDEETRECIRQQHAKLVEQLRDDYGYQTPEEMPELYDYSNLWMVETDLSVGEAGLTAFRWAPIEIKSPVLYYDEKSTNLVRRVVNLLASEFRILSNETTMFHVHVGRGNTGFSMNDLRMIGSVLYAATPRMDQLHPIHCGPLALWAPGVRTHSLMANLSDEDSRRARFYKKEPKEDSAFMTQKDDGNRRGWDEESTMDEPYHSSRIGAHPLLEQWKGHQRAHAFGVLRIWSAENLTEFYDRVGTVYQDPDSVTRHYRANYNFRNLMKDPVVKNTIEFRQHAGTMDALSIKNWIKTTCGIVDACIHAHFDESISPILRRLEHKDPNSHQSFIRNKPIHNPTKINVTHTLHAVEGEPYSICYSAKPLIPLMETMDPTENDFTDDFLWDMNLGPQAEWYRSKGLHPLPADCGEIVVKGEPKKQFVFLQIPNTPWEERMAQWESSEEENQEGDEEEDGEDEYPHKQSSTQGK